MEASMTFDDADNRGFADEPVASHDAAFDDLENAREPDPCFQRESGYARSPKMFVFRNGLRNLPDGS